MTNPIFDFAANYMFNAENVQADAKVADALMKKENSFEHRLA